MKILSAAVASPKNSFSQEEVLRLLGYKDDLRRSFFHSSRIKSRRLYIPKDFKFEETLVQANQRAVEGVTELALKAARSCVARAGVSPKDIDCLVTTTCTAALMPNLDVRVIEGLKLRPDVERAHLGDMGSASGVLALKAASNFVKANRESRALVIASEVCSACYSQDGSLDSAVGEAIFADGAAAVLISSKKKDRQKPGFQILASHALVRPQYAPLMRFDYPQGRRRFVLSKEIRDTAARLFCDFTRQFLKKKNLKKEDIAYWIFHPAGRKILDNIRDLTGLDEHSLKWTRDIFKNYGNISSATALFVLNKVLNSARLKKGDLALLAAMGPGLAAEGLLLRWE